MAPKRNRAALAREHNRRRQPDRSTSKRASTPAAATRRAAAATCGWCRGPIELKSTGRIPKWCSPACRQRAWEQARASASGRPAVEVVERTPRRDQWPPLLRELTAQLDTGRIYTRDLPELALAVEQLAAASTAADHAPDPTSASPVRVSKPKLPGAQSATARRHPARRAMREFGGELYQASSWSASSSNARPSRRA